MAKFALILYMNRSGSTLLSRRLSEQGSDICVLPEMPFLLQLLMARDVGTRYQGQSLLDLMKSDPRCDALGLSETDLQAIAARNSSDDLQALLTDIARAKLGVEPSLVVFKLNTFIYYRDQLSAALPGLAIIHIVRDPRAVVNSMLRSPIPEKPGFNMARGSAIYAANSWCDYVGALETETPDRLHFTLRYEDLETRFDDFVQTLSAALGIRLAAPAGDSPRYHIAAIDGVLHPNVFKPFQADRLEAWQREMDPRDIEIVEYLCADKMRAFGYRPLSNRDMTYARRAWARFRHLRAMAVNHASSLMIYVRRPGGLRELAGRMRLARRQMR